MTLLTYIGPHKNPLYISRVYGTGEHGGGVNQERVANARLIAAAPDLLEALKAALSFMEDVVREQSIADTITENKARKAIAKAEGKE